MIVLPSEPLTKDYTIRQLAEFDTKAAILASFDLIHVGIAKSNKKASLAYVLDKIFNEEPAYFCNVLPEEEQRLLSKLVAIPQDHYVESPVKKNQYLLMQKLHLVVSYEAGDMWHIYMPDSIRRRIDKMAQADLQHYPELMEFNSLLEEITAKRTRLYEMMDNNTPKSLNGDKQKQFTDEIRSIDQFYIDAKKRLKKLEPYLKKNTKIDLNIIKDDLKNAEFMLSLAKFGLNLKEQASTNISSPKVKTNTTKLVNTQDIRKAHPRGLNCSSDQEYTDFANRVVKAMRTNSESADWSNDYLRTIAIKVTIYFEDLVSEVGLWKTFVNKHQQLYGKPLPFYDVDPDYSADYPCQQDVQYLIWDALIELQEETLPNPENVGLQSIARDITSLMEEEFEDIAINDDLVNFLHGAQYCNDFYELRQVLKWFYFDCYLTSGRFTDYYYEKEIEFYADSMHADPRNAAYGAECLMPFNQKIGPLALEPKEWLSLFLEQLGKEKEAADVREVYCSDVEPFQLVSYDAEFVWFRNWCGEEFPVRRTEMFNCPEKQLKDPKVNGSIGTFVCYRGEWFLSGLNSWGDISEPWDGYCQEKQTWTNAYVPNYQHLMDISGGCALFYFSGIDELRKFNMEEMGVPEDSYQSPPMKGKVKNVIQFCPEEHGEMGYLVNDAECICDPRNPFYDKAIAKRDSLNLITDVDSVPGEFVRYAVAHNLLPDACINSISGEERGRELTQQNLDFLARTLRRQEY